jgi:hypothetical protein
VKRRSERGRQHGKRRSLPKCRWSGEPVAEGTDLAQQHLQNVREEIRAAGYFEPDSLLCLTDGEDKHLLSIIMSYLTFEELGRCELVSRGLKQAATYCWEDIDKKLILAIPFRTAPSARNSRERVVWYHSASNLAKHIGSMGEKISKHLAETFLDRERDVLVDRRVLNCCRGCNFPDCNLVVLRSNEIGNFELFVRFSRTHDNFKFAEGFFPHEFSLSGLEISLEEIDFSDWPNMAEVTRMARGYNEEGDPPNEQLLIQAMRVLTVRVIAVDKRNSQSSMVIAQSDFACADRRDGGIDNMGGHGFCWPKGELSLYSHGAIETEFRGGGMSSSYDNKEPSSKLGMLFDTVEWRDPYDENRVIQTECYWTLQISRDNINRKTNEEDDRDEHADY